LRFNYTIGFELLTMFPNRSLRASYHPGYEVVAMVYVQFDVLADGVFPFVGSQRFAVLYVGYAGMALLLPATINPHL
jgi:hypothetical protein